MLLQRVLAAAVLIVILVPVILWGRVEGIAILVGVLSGVGLLEMARVLPELKVFPQKQITVVLGPLIAAAFYAAPPAAVLAVPVWMPLFVLLVHLVLYHRIEKTIESTSQMILAAAYVAIPLGHAILLRRTDLGVAWVFFVLVITCLGDAGAYFAGRSFGKHHFASSVSPSKTIEGLLGSLAANFIGMLAMKSVVPELPSLGNLVILTLLLALSGPVGDLCASAIKRKAQVKDFGSSIPGHGGLMDRADSLIFSFPITYYFLVLTGSATLR
jgi:phosphatidate cytidylyltransferase